MKMKNLRLLLITIMCIVAMNASAQKKFSVYGVGFYNQENLFDTCHDVGYAILSIFPMALTDGMPANIRVNSVICPEHWQIWVLTCCQM